MKKRVFSFVFALAMTLSLIPSTALALGSQNTETTINFATFLKEVEAAGYNYDGEGITVQWSPSSACTNSLEEHECLFTAGNPPAADGNNPQRGQIPNAQYQIFSGTGNISISNVNFQFIPGEFTICMNSNWRGSYTADQCKNAELQLLNTGDVTFTNCTFDAVIASPFSSTTTSTFIDCTFENVYNAYAIKDVHSPNLIVEGCTFNHCGGGIYLEGSASKNIISIINNNFSDIDTYAAADKVGTRGLIQFSASGDYSNAQVSITGNRSTGSAAVLRQLNSTVTAAVVDEKEIAQNNNFDDTANFFVGGTSVTANKIIYVNPQSGNDSNDGSEFSPLKTISAAMAKVNAGDTILVSGSIGHNFFNGITKPVNIQGVGDVRVSVSGGVQLPQNVNGTVKLSNFSFDGTSTIGLYGNTTNTAYAGLDLVIDNCAFTQASGNCVYIIPQINSLTITDCTFSAPESQTTYQNNTLFGLTPQNRSPLPGVPLMART